MKPETPPDLHNVWMLGWVSFFTDMASAMVRPLIPVYVVLVLQQGADKLGVVVAVSTFISFALRWVGGWLSDHLDRNKPLLLAGYGLSAVIKPLIGLAGSWQWVAVLVGSERLGKAIRSAPKDKLISLSSSQQRQGRAFGLHKTLDIAGETLGALLAFLLLFAWGESAAQVRQVFFYSALPSLMAVAVLVLSVRDRGKGWSAEQPASLERMAPLSAALQWKLALFFLANAVVVGEAFLLLRAHEVGFATRYLPLLVVAGGLTQTLLSYPGGRLADEWGDERILLAGVLAGLGSLLLLAAGQPMAVLAGFVLQGSYLVLTLNATRMRLGRIQQAKGRVYGWFYTLNALAGAGGALLAGWLWTRLGGQQTLLLLAAFLAVALAGYALCRSFACREGS